MDSNITQTNTEKNCDLFRRKSVLINESQRLEKAKDTWIWKMFYFPSKSWIFIPFSCQSLCHSSPKSASESVSRTLQYEAANRHPKPIQARIMHWNRSEMKAFHPDLSWRSNRQSTVNDDFSNCKIVWSDVVNSRIDNLLRLNRLIDREGLASRLMMLFESCWKKFGGLMVSYTIFVGRAAQMFQNC